MSDRSSTTPPPPPGWDPAQGAPAGPPPAAEQARSRSWFARHKILTGILAVLAVFAVGGALSGGDDADSTAAQTSVEPAHASTEEGTGSSASSQGSTADESAAEEEDATAKKKAGATTAPRLGDSVEVGDFTVRVTDVEPGVEWIGDSTFGEGPQGQFVKVYVTVENTGSEADYFLDSEQKLVDDQDRQHSTSSSAWLLDEESLFLTEINPGNKVEGVLLYDVPVDAVPVAVDLQSGWLGKAVRVTLDG
ncbi:DUF4352 domain-containing protein [Ornithinimicrobium avium]|uniref:DUF4352 domain-containing protein n=1 Tax=Ornithinimicrobium avium TaxID=2283195 RepID=A0A345NKI9_9MICO|nr:DUF4352 domain-containing protein [Ornithinimicrobium avium]AXH95547.1 DUF4352 domain-containing protein [Ornithinimicrobium avium]